MATVKKMVKKAAPKKAQKGVAEYKSQWGKKTADSTRYFTDKMIDNLKGVSSLRNAGLPREDYRGYEREANKAMEDAKRQKRKGLPGFDANGFPVKKSKMGSKVKSKMKTGGTLSPSKKSVGKTLGKLNKAKYGSKTSKKK